MANDVQPIATVYVEKKSLRVNSLDCDELDLHLKLETNAKWYKRDIVTEVWQIGKDGERNLLGEWEKHPFKKDRLRTSRDVEFQLMNDIFPRTYGRPFSVTL